MNINYVKIAKSIKHNKYEKREENKKELYSCFGCCDLCTHPNKCLFNYELMQLRQLIIDKQMKLKESRELYDYALSEKQAHPNKQYNELFSNYDPRETRINMNVLKSELRVLHRKEENLITKPGGF